MDVLYPAPMTAAELDRHLRAADAEACRRSLAEFVKLAWPVIEPGVPLMWGWHIDAVCAHLEAVTRGEILKLVINIPPGTMKSTLVSVLWKSWEWIDRPHLRYLTGSYDEKLAMRDATKTRDIITSPWYRDTFRPTWRLARAQNAKSYFCNTAQGFRLAFAIGGKVTGWRGDGVVLDDPLNARDQYNVAVKAAAMWKFDKVLSTRVNDPRAARFIVVMQRLADDDPSGELLRRTAACVDENGDPLRNPDGSPMVDADGQPLRVPLYDHLCLPSEFEPARRNVTSIGWTDPRKEEGELLFPAFFTRRVIEELKESLGPEGFAGQHQQRPVPAGGGGFKDADWCYWDWDIPAEQMVRLFRPDGSETIVRLEHCRLFTTVDPAVALGARNDPSAYHTWAVTPETKDLLLLDEVCERMEEPESVARAKGVKATWPRSTHFAVEANGVGRPLVQNLIRAGLTVEPVIVGVDKWAASTTARIRAQNRQIYLPRSAGWMPAWKTEVNLFPASQHDERVTTLSIAAEQVYLAPGQIATATPVARDRPPAYRPMATPQPTRSLYGQKPPRDRDRRGG